MAGELLGFNDVNLGQRIVDAYSLLAVCFLFVSIPLALIYREYVLRRVTILALVSVIVAFYALAFFFTQVLLYTGVVPDNAILIGIILSFVTTGIVTALMTRVFTRRRREVQLDGLKFSEKRSERRGRQGNVTTASPANRPATKSTPRAKTPAAPAHTRPMPPTAAKQAQQRPPAAGKPQPVRIQRADEIGDVDWESEMQRLQSPPPDSDESE